MGGQQQAANLHVRVHKFLVDARPIFGYWMVGERRGDNKYVLSASPDRHLEMMKKIDRQIRRERISMVCLRKVVWS